jgi:uncharacterized protein (DUF885 family)
MKQMFFIASFFLLTAVAFCQASRSAKDLNPNKSFQKFETVFLDNYWKQYPSKSIFIGFGKYYTNLAIPDSATFKADLAFSTKWLDSLKHLPVNNLDENNKISYNIIKNQLESDIWYRSVFKPQEWDPAMYNLSGECFYLINQPYAPLDKRLKFLSEHLQKSDEYYRAAFKNLNRPTREHTELAVLQNQAGLEVFGSSLTDSINASHLASAEKDSLVRNIAKATTAIKAFVDSLSSILANRNHEFRSFRIGKELFTEKFKYDLATDLTPEQIYNKAIEEKKNYHDDMYNIAYKLWSKYYGAQNRPKDSLLLVQLVINKAQLQHARPGDFFDTLTSQLHQLKRFIITKNLFDFDTSYPVKVRIMPAYQSGVAVANAECTPPYQKQGNTYYNIDDLTKYPEEKAEGTLREYNNFSSQFLSIHEAIPGHCLQGIYNNKKSADVVRSVFRNGAMVEGWASYTETMMVENGWGNNTPEIKLFLDKLKLRELANVIIDYDIQCLNKSKEEILKLLTHECFQTEAQAQEKYHRATVSQVQLCSYHAGATAIFALRSVYKKKMGTRYSLKDFHEKFLSYGSAPVKYISERMLGL